MSNYYQKYIKYKKKYLNLLDKLKGGSPELNLVSGPMSFRHLHNFETGRNLFIFGDVHESINNLCSPERAPDLHFKIEEIIKQNPNVQFDIGVEDGLYSRRNVAFQQGPMNLFKEHFEKINDDKTYPNLRLQFLDVRNIDISFNDGDIIYGDIIYNNSDPVVVMLNNQEDTFQNLVRFLQSTSDIANPNSHSDLEIENSDIADNSPELLFDILPSYERESLETFTERNGIFKIPFNNLKLILHMLLQKFYALINMEYFYKDQETISNYNKFLEDPTKKVIVNIGNKHGFDISGNTINVYKCSLENEPNINYNFTVNNCSPNYDLRGRLERNIINLVKMNNKISKSYRDKNIQNRSIIDLKHLDIYISKRVSNIINENYKKLYNFGILEKNIAKVSHFLKDYKKYDKMLRLEIMKNIPDNLLHKAYLLLLNDDDNKIYFNINEISDMISALRSICNDINVLIMDVYSILRLSKKYFNNTILYLGDKHSTNIAKYFSEFNNYKLILEISDLNTNTFPYGNLESEPSRCINIGNSFDKINLKLPPYDSYIPASEEDMEPITKGEELFYREEIRKRQIYKQDIENRQELSSQEGINNQPKQKITLV